MGMPIGNSRWCANTVADVLHYYAGAVDKHLGQTIPVAGGIAMTFNEPIGVVGLITPWNFPMLIASWKLGPALACGNTVVIKPAEITPLTTIRLGQLALEAGVPEGVLNVVVGTGAEAGWRLVEHPARAQDRLHRLDGGRQADHGRLRRAGEAGDASSSAARAPTSCSPTPISPLRLPAPGSPCSTTPGQDCCARSRILVERSVADRFTELLIDAAKGFSHRRPARSSSTAMGPLVTAAHRDEGSGLPQRGRRRVAG